MVEHAAVNRVVVGSSPTSGAISFLVYSSDPAHRFTAASAQRSTACFLVVLLLSVKGKLLLPVVLMVAFALTRLPGILPQNFSAAYALMFCAGVFFPGRLAWWLPMATMLVMDCVLSLGFYHANPFSIYMVPNYIAYAAAIFLGKKFSPQTHWLKLIGGGLLAAIVFYVVTNTSSWIELPYPKTFLGWLQALTIGLPDVKPPTWVFFRNTLLSGGLFTALFVASVKATDATESEEEKEEAKEPVPEPANAPEEAGA